MAKRKSIGIKLRFDVFKRDSFKCQYCGNTAPDVLLEVDHINPVVKGGTNELVNLITSCIECNRGKRDGTLSENSSVAKQRNQLEQLQERREQLDMMLKWHNNIKTIEQDSLETIVAYWNNIISPYELNDIGIADLKRILKKFNVGEILKAMDDANDNYIRGDINNDNTNYAFDKIKNIASVNKDSINDPDLKDLLYIRGIIRNRLERCNLVHVMDWLRAARSWNVPIESLKSVAYNVNTMNQLSDRIDFLIQEYKTQ